MCSGLLFQKDDFAQTQTTAVVLQLYVISHGINCIVTLGAWPDTGCLEYNIQE